MTPQDLTTLIERGPTEQMVAALAPLTEAERKKLAKEVVALRKEISRREAEKTRLEMERFRRPPTPPSPCPFCGKMLRTAASQQCFECGKNWHEPKAESPSVRWTCDSAVRLNLALMAVGPWTETQRIRVWNVTQSLNRRQDDLEFLFRIIKDRKPDWLSKWADKELAVENFSNWGLVRRLVRAQFCAKPQGENYTLKMVRGFVSHEAKKSLKDSLLADPELLHDEVWRIFELSPTRGTILDSYDLTYVPQANYPCMSWSTTLLALAAEGHLDRQRLLAASLGSLLRNTEARNTTWFYRFHEFLKPTPDERLAVQPSYLQLLSHPISAVVGMALDALVVLEKARMLDVGGFLDAAGAVFHLQPKAAPLTTIKLLGRISARQTRQGAPIAAVLLSGLSHPQAQVQQAIIDLLAKLGDEASEVIASRLPDLVDSLAPSVQEQARALLPTPDAPPDETIESTGADELIEEARRIPSPWREQAGIDALLQAFDGVGSLKAVAFDPMGVPRLDPAQRVEPIQTLDALIERLTIAVETLDDGIEFELLLDGLSRLCDQRPADFEARVAPLLHRTQSVMQQGALPTIAAIGLRSLLVKTVRQWCAENAMSPREERDSILGFLDVRVGVLLVRLRKKQALPLLACPTHRQGWIDPRTMLERLSWYEQHTVEPSQFDFIQGILRLAPDHRADVLAEAGGFRGKFASAFRFALGGPLEDKSLAPAILIAAGRARTPFAELSDLRDAEIWTGPDAGEPAAYSFDGSKSSTDEPVACPTCGKTLRTPRALQCFECGAKWHEQRRADLAAGNVWIPTEAMIRLAVEPNVPAPELIRDLPTVLLHVWLIPNELAWSGSASKGVLRWVATVWPANPSPFFAIGIRLRRASFSVASIYRQRAVFLESLFDPDVPFTETAQLLVALALNQAESEVANLAVDALIELIGDGRCVGPELGNVLRSLVTTDLVKFNRLTKHLENVGRASPLHAHACAEIVQTACAGLADIPKDLHLLLTPLLEWLTSLNQGVRDEFRPVLEKTTTGKAGALAKRLLQRTFEAKGPQQFLVDALNGRLRRARRWEALEQPAENGTCEKTNSDARKVRAGGGLMC